MNRGLRTHALRAHDAGAARDWYARAFGVKPYFESEHYIGFDIGGYELGIEPMASNEPVLPGSATAYWACDDVASTLERLRSQGATLVQPATDVGEGIVVGSIRDPFGNSLGFIQNPHFAPPLASAGASNLASREIVVRATVARPRAEVWRLWTTSEGMAEWLVRSSRIALRPGGHYELHFLDDGPAGARGSEGCRVLSFVPERMLSFTWNAPPHLDRVRRERTWVVVEMHDHPDGCEVSVTHTGWPTTSAATDPQWEEAFHYFARAWPRVVDRLVQRGAEGPLGDV